MTEVVTFGCRLNNVESETMQRLAQAAGLDNVAAAQIDPQKYAGMPEVDHHSYYSAAKRSSVSLRRAAANA